jgi:hypothetical protein
MLFNDSTKEAKLNDLQMETIIGTTDTFIVPARALRIERLHMKENTIFIDFRKVRISPITRKISLPNLYP